MYDDVIYGKNGQTAIIRMNRPKTLNALNKHLKSELASAFAEAGSDETVKAIVLRGEGERAFSSGQDLAETVNMPATGADDWIDSFGKLYDAIREQHKPTIAALNGVAAGSGLQIALLCDFRIAKRGIKIGMTEIDVGLPLITGSGLLWRLVGPMRTREIALTGKLFTADEALGIGLVNKVVQEELFDKEVMSFAENLASKPPNAVRINKGFYRKLEDELYHLSLEYAAKAHFEAYQSGEPQSCMEKFFKVRSKKAE